jgi:hypothetical protein
MSPRRPDPVAGALVAVRLAVLAALVLSHQETVTGGFNGDVFRYVEMATASGVPYRDVAAEYPPVTLAAIVALAGGGAARAMVAVAVSQVACDVGIAAVLGARWGRAAARWYLLLGLAFLPYPFPYLRVDLVAVLLATAAFALVTARSARRWALVAGGAVLALAVLAKIWPLALAPALLRRDRRPALVGFVAAGLVLGGAWLVVAGAAGPQQVLSFRSAAGWQVESIAGSLRHLLDPSGLHLESGAFRTGVMPGFARPLLTALAAAAAALAWWAARRTGDDAGGGDDEVATALAAVTAVLVFAPILSPQYVLWLLPFAAVVAAGGDRLIGRLTAAAMALTTLTCVLVGAVATGWRAATALVVARNAVLVALLVVALQRVAGVRAGQSQSRDRKYRNSEPVATSISPSAKG